MGNYGFSVAPGRRRCRGICQGSKCRTFSENWKVGEDALGVADLCVQPVNVFVLIRCVCCSASGELVTRYGWCIHFGLWRDRCLPANWTVAAGRRSVVSVEHQSRQICQAHSRILHEFQIVWVWRSAGNSLPDTPEQWSTFEVSARQSACSKDWLDEGSRIFLDEDHPTERESLEVLHTPGHTPDSISLWPCCAPEAWVLQVLRASHHVDLRWFSAAPEAAFGVFVIDVCIFFPKTERLMGACGVRYLPAENRLFSGDLIYPGLV